MEQLKEISAEVLRILKIRYPVGRSLVGITNRAQDILGLLEVDAKDVRVVWLHGMPDIGKTTLADIVYNKIVDQFGGRCCFLKGIRSMSSSTYTSSLWQWQKLLIATIFERDHNLINDNVAKYLLNHCLCREKVLLVLDDVDDVKLFDELIGNLRFGLGSRVIVTTRNVRQIQPNIGRIYTYEVRKLDHHEALLLFCKNSFNQDSPPDKWVTLSNKIVEAAGGLPLAITDVASFLFSRKNNNAGGELDCRLGIKEQDMLNFKICFNALDDMQKEVFLDIACFFSGADVRIPTHMWRDCNSLLEDHGTIEALHLMSMIKIGDDQKLWMHDLFRVNGRAMVEEENVNEPGERSRLWGADAYMLLHDKEVTNMENN